MEFHPDTIPSNEQIRETLADRIYHPYKKQIWGIGVLIAVGVVGFLGVREHRRARLNEQWDRHDRSLSAQRLIGQGGAVNAAAVQAQITALDALVRDFPQDGVTPWALVSKVDAQHLAKDFDGALATLSELRDSHPDFAYFRLPASARSDSESLADRKESLIRKEKSWAEKTAYVHRWPDEKRLALVETTKGNFWIGFYEEDAPERVAAFVKRAKEGHYNGSQVFEIRQDTDGTAQLFSAGSIASRTEADPANHDRDEPADTIEPEESRFKLRHLQRMVTALNMPSGESASAFMVITARDGMQRFDTENTPFGAVLERDGGLDVIRVIGTADTYNTNPKTSLSKDTYRVRDHPYPYVMIDRVSIWTDEKLEDGHTWDTARVAANEPPLEPHRPEEWLPPDVREKKKDEGEKKGDEATPPEKKDGDDDPKDEDGGDEPK